MTFNCHGARVSTQSVINNGTQVASATKNTIGNQTCNEKFNGCMDAFCMLDNMPGGRCQCSNTIFKLSEKQKQIDEIKSQTKQLATSGTITIETADIQANNIDLSLWNNNVSDDDDDIIESDDERGDELFLSASALCLERMPECESNADMMQLMYSQQIKSDCIAYENGLKTDQNNAATALATTQSEMRGAAYAKLQSENKYTLGECVSEFQKCMQTTAGCGNDFSKCATISAFDITNTRGDKSRATQIYNISGEYTNIDITMSTYETLDAKRPICESVLKQCTSMADRVWETFLHANAPQIKNAELIAENNSRTDCIGNISECFRNACHDKFDPADDDDSYDMCLTRPATMMSFCAPELNACGIDTADEKSAEKSPIWNYVLARLASMRVDSCTTAVRECLTSPDVCGDDYSQCVGMDTDTIIRMCPYDKLVGCQKMYGDTEIREDRIYDELSTMVTGLMVNIDNGILATCQNALNESMLRTCGTTTGCNSIIIDDNLGATSLDYNLCQYVFDESAGTMGFGDCRNSVSDITDTELGRVVGATSGSLGPVTPFAGLINGTMYWESIGLDNNGKLTTTTEYLNKIGAPKISESEQELIENSISAVQQQINSIISTIESDPIVEYCTTGRTVQGMEEIFGDQTPRFPNLTQSMRLTVGNYILNQARENYAKRYNQMTEQMLSDYNTIAERQAVIRGENGKDARREAARQSCVSLASLAAMPKAPEPPKNMLGTIIIAAAIIAATVVISIATVGTGTGAMAIGVSILASVGNSVSTAVAAAITAGVVAGMAGVGAGISAGINAIASGSANGKDIYTAEQLKGHYEVNDFNYRETVDTTFDPETLVCEKCVISQPCEDVKNPIFGTKKCKAWGEKTETCTDIEF